MVKKNKILKTTGELVIGGVGIGFGASILGKLPSTPATTQVQVGMTRFARFTPLFGTLAAAGIVTHQLKGIEKQIKRKKRRK